MHERGLQVAAPSAAARLAGLKPWQHRSWISVRDPEFAAKAAAVLGLYARIWDGKPLGEGDYVICAVGNLHSGPLPSSPTPGKGPHDADGA